MGLYDGLVQSGLLAIIDPYNGSGQTITDQSGNGNNAMLGSTSNADTNDPTFSGAGISFGSDDYLKLTQTVFNDMAQLSVITAFSATGTASNRIFDKTRTRMHYNATKMRFFDTFGTANLIADTSSAIPTNIPVVVGVSYETGVIPVFYINNAKNVTTTVQASNGTHTTNATYNLVIGNNEWSANNLSMLYLQVWYNRTITDAEYQQNFNSIGAIMYSRGITLDGYTPTEPPTSAYYSYIIAP